MERKIMNTLKRLILITTLFFISFYSLAQSEGEWSFGSDNDLHKIHCEVSIEYFNQYYSNDTTLNELAKTILVASLAAEKKNKDTKVIEEKYKNQYSVLMRKEYAMEMGMDSPVMQFYVRIEQDTNETIKDWTVNETPFLSLPYKKYGYAFITERDENGVEGYMLILFSKN